MTKLYLGAPMRGVPRNNFPAIDDAAEFLRARGYEVVAPTDLDRAVGFDEDTPHTPGTFAQVMRADIAALLDVEGVVFLKGWRDSEGCRIEWTVALAIGLPIYEYSHGNLLPVWPAVA